MPGPLRRDVLQPRLVRGRACTLRAPHAYGAADACQTLTPALTLTLTLAPTLTLTLTLTLKVSAPSACDPCAIAPRADAAAPAIEPVAAVVPVVVC